jgi:hypothetical protein
MNYMDTDTTVTDWNEYGMRDQAERRRDTGVSAAHGHPGAGLAGDSQADHRAESRWQSKKKLKKMFDRFLYQK